LTAAIGAAELATNQAGEAHERAANAELETERLKKQFGGRHLIGEQPRKIADALREKAASIDVLIEFQASDPEAFSYGIEIWAVFGMADIEKRRFISNSYISGMVFGLWFAASPEIDASSIAKAFKDADVPLLVFEKDLSKHLLRTEPAPNLYIFVAPKPPLANWHEVQKKAIQQQQAASTTRESNI
jgi:hypothetical protein